MRQCWQEAKLGSRNSAGVWCFVADCPLEVPSSATLFFWRCVQARGRERGSSIPILLGLLVRDLWLIKRGLGSSKYRRPVRISGPLSTVSWPWRASPIGLH